MSTGVLCRKASLSICFAMRRLEEILAGLKYDLCVLTGDYRAATFGNFEDTLALIRRILPRIERPVYGVLGNHDTIRMVPDLEAMGIRMLLNECEPIERGGARRGGGRSDTIWIAHGSITADAPLTNSPFSRTEVVHLIHLLLTRQIEAKRRVLVCLILPTAIRSTLQQPCRRQLESRTATYPGSLSSAAPIDVQ